VWVTFSFQRGGWGEGQGRHIGQAIYGIIRLLVVGAWRAVSLPADPPDMIGTMKSEKHMKERVHRTLYPCHRANAQVIHAFGFLSDGPLSNESLTSGFL
jgi:hypothetical protein